MSRLRWTTAGESHGPALVGVVEGVPSGLALSIGLGLLEDQKQNAVAAE